MKEPITPALIKQLSAMCGDPPDFGVYRDRASVLIGRPHKPPSASAVPGLVRDMCERINALKDQPAYAAAYALWRVNWIHPFRDGNGRVARALAARICGYTTNVQEFIYRNYPRYLDGLEYADTTDQSGNLDILPLMDLIKESKHDLAPVAPTRFSCGTCAHWIHLPDTKNRGECRRFPPSTTIFGVRTPQGFQPTDQTSAYPNTPENFPACAEHKSR